MDRLTDFQRQVQDAIGPSYRILRELGGGGMSRVFQPAVQDVKARLAQLAAEPKP